MTIHKEEITGLILAGGRATRMGGVDKGLQWLNDEPMIAHVIRRLQPQVGSLMINANRNLDTYQQFDVPVIADDIGGFAGPLAGLHAGLAQCHSEFLVTVPCDAPMLPSDLVARLSAALEREHCDVAVAATNQGAGNQRQPVFMLARITLLPQLTAWLNTGGRKVDDWLHSVNATEARFDDDHAFENVNTTGQLVELSRRFS